MYINIYIYTTLHLFLLVFSRRSTGTLPNSRISLERARNALSDGTKIIEKGCVPGQQIPVDSIPRKFEKYPFLVNQVFRSSGQLQGDVKDWGR